ncbi:MAG: tetratricopeptide repeat protein [Bacteroidota bacterium]
MSQFADIQEMLDFLQDKGDLDSQRSIEARLKTDTAFALAMEELERALFEEGKSREEIFKVQKGLQAVIKEKSNAFVSAEAAPKKKSLYPYLMAAAITLLVLVGGAYLLNRPASNQELVSMYMDMPATGLNRGPNNRQSLSQAIEKAESGNNKEAVQLFRAYIDQNPDARMARLQLAVCLIRLNELDAAKVELNGVKNDPQSLPSVTLRAKWYLALAYLKGDQVPEAIPLLMEVQAGASQSRKEKARLILQELD